MKPFKKARKKCPLGDEFREPESDSCLSCGSCVHRTETRAAGRPSFTCPGCGGRATSRVFDEDTRGTLCKSCNSFVHLDCLQKVTDLGESEGWEWACPVCGDVIWEGYLSGMSGRPAH